MEVSSVKRAKNTKMSTSKSWSAKKDLHFCFEPKSVDNGFMLSAEEKIWFLWHFCYFELRTPALKEKWDSRNDVCNSSFLFKSWDNSIWWRYRPTIPFTSPITFPFHPQKWRLNCLQNFVPISVWHCKKGLLSKFKEHWKNVNERHCIMTFSMQ